MSVRILRPSLLLKLRIPFQSIVAAEAHTLSKYYKALIPFRHPYYFMPYQYPIVASLIIDIVNVLCNEKFVLAISKDLKTRKDIIRYMHNTNKTENGGGNFVVVAVIW